MNGAAIVRLTMVSHGMTDAMAAGRFALDESLNSLGRRQVSQLSLSAAAAARCGPELRARQSAELLGFAALVDPDLADLNVGHWRGADLAAVDPGELIAWRTDPGYTPVGGESIVELLDRVRRWLSGLAEPQRLVAIAHPAVVRAVVLVALAAPASAFWSVDVTPASAVVLHRRGGAWMLRL